MTFGEVFKKSFHGVSVDDIVEKTELTKGALYHQFPTKLELGYALVEEVIRPMILERWVVPLEKYENPIEGILHQMRTLIGGSDRKILKFGCPLNNIVQEMAPIDKGFRDRLKKSLELWILETNKHLVRAKTGGFLKKDIDTMDVARFVVMSHEGFYGLIKGTDDPKLFSSLIKSLEIYFNSISNRPL